MQLDVSKPPRMKVVISKTMAMAKDSHPQTLFILKRRKWLKQRQAMPMTGKAITHMRANVIQESIKFMRLPSL